MNHPTVRVYSEQTGKVKYVQPEQVALLQGLGYYPQSEPEKLEPIVLATAPVKDETIEVPAPTEKPKVKPKTTKK